ncbi:hypothetical protein QP699_30060, partial [Klebsiella michiganensis]|nr:hypothetical protein [Klebsiella michiganensis]
SAQIREILISESAWEEMTCLFAPSLESNIWIWQKGAIENHLGLTEKSESAWAEFKSNAEAQPLSDICTDYDSVEDLVAWITPVV